jgi:hypothetical protein
VPGPLGDLGGPTPPLSQVETHACRRSYTRRASCDAYSPGGVRLRALCPIRSGT